jgi:hypothetical protein
MLRRLPLIALSIYAIGPAALAGPTNFFNFETAAVHPIALGPDGRTLAVRNLPDNRLELFDVSTGVPVCRAGEVCNFSTAPVTNASDVIRISRPTLSGGALKISVLTETNKTYTIEYSDSLNPFDGKH